MKRPTDEEILGALQEITHGMAIIETAIDELICDCKLDDRRFKELRLKHLKLSGEIQALRWVLGFCKYKDL